VVADHREAAGTVAGAVLILLGLHIAGLVPLRRLETTARLFAVTRPAGIAGAFVVGIAFAFGWSPCIGPMLAAILTLAGARDSLAYAPILLVVCGLAMALPFLFAAALAGPFARFLTASAALMPVVRWTSAAVIIVTGIAILTDTFTWVGFWMLQAFP